MDVERIISDIGVLGGRAGWLPTAAVSAMIIRPVSSEQLATERWEQVCHVVSLAFSPEVCTHLKEDIDDPSTLLGMLGRVTASVNSLVACS